MALKKCGVVGLLLLSACASKERKPFTSAECSFDGGRERGFSEGKGGRDPDSDYASLCREDTRDAVRKGYREGYDLGRSEYKAMIAKWEESRGEKPTPIETPPSPVYFCSITYRGRGFQAQGKTIQEARDVVMSQCVESFPRRACAPLVSCSEKDAAAASPKAYYCKIEVFGETYDAFSPTELEGRIQASRNCGNKQGADSIFCRQDHVKCQKNQ